MNFWTISLLLLQAASLALASPVTRGHSFAVSSVSDADYEAAKAALRALSTTPILHDRAPAPDRVPVGASTKWHCRRTGDSNHAALWYMHAIFRRHFGQERLQGGPNECFVARCAGYHFSWCNTTAAEAEEDAGARDLVAQSDPGFGTSCAATVVGAGFDEYKTYFFGKMGTWGGPDYGGGVREERCEMD